MFAVIFEVQPKKERWSDYLALAKHLKPRLEAIDGFIDNERFASTRTEGRLLSLSTWRDEKAVVRWRIQREHHGVQEQGRFEIFADYHLRVGEVTGDTEPPPGLALEQQRFDTTAIGEAKLVTIIELASAKEGVAALKADEIAQQFGLAATDGALVGHEVFASIYNPGKLLLLAGWRDAAAGEAWTPTRPDGASLRHRRVRVIRDYGMFERREAPQFFPAVQKP